MLTNGAKINLIWALIRRILRKTLPDSTVRWKSRPLLPLQYLTTGTNPTRIRSTYSVDKGQSCRPGIQLSILSIETMRPVFIVEFDPQIVNVLHARGNLISLARLHQPLSPIFSALLAAYFHLVHIWFPMLPPSHFALSCLRGITD